MSPSPSLMPVLTSFFQGFAECGAESFEPLSPCASDAPSNNNGFQLSPAHAAATAARSPSCRVAVSGRRSRSKRVDYVKLSQLDLSSEDGGSAHELEDDAGFYVEAGQLSPQCAAPAPSKRRVAVQRSQQASSLPPTQLPDYGDCEVEREADALKAAEQCSCRVLNVLRLPDLKKFSKARKLRVTKTKTQLLLQFCAVCKDEAAVVAATAKKETVSHEGIKEEFWDWNVAIGDHLSILSAFHLAMTNAAHDPLNSGFANILNGFRAHLMSHIACNFRFYIIQGKVNRVNGAGQVRVDSRAVRVMNFTAACASMLDHYRGDHRVLTCGNLRKGLPCHPFTLITNFDEQLTVICRRNIFAVIAAVAAAECLLQDPYPDQQQLRLLFHLN